MAFRKPQGMVVMYFERSVRIKTFSRFFRVLQGMFVM
jgi:hypothetical protein